MVIPKTSCHTSLPDSQVSSFSFFQFNIDVWETGGWVGGHGGCGDKDNDKATDNNLKASVCNALVNQ